VEHQDICAVNPTQDYVGQAARGVENGIAQFAQKNTKERDQLASDRKNSNKDRSNLRILRV
jgi:hypothetical protein